MLALCSRSFSLGYSGMPVLVHSPACSIKHLQPYSRNIQKIHHRRQTLTAPRLSHRTALQRTVSVSTPTELGRDRSLVYNIKAARSYL